MRSTNVYEERSLGVFEDEDQTPEDEPSPTGPRVAVWGRYLAWHARKQLAFGQPSTIHWHPADMMFNARAQICGGLALRCSLFALSRLVLFLFDRLL